MTAKEFKNGWDSGKYDGLISFHITENDLLNMMESYAREVAILAFDAGWGLSSDTQTYRDCIRERGDFLSTHDLTGDILGDEK